MGVGWIIMLLIVVIFIYFLNQNRQISTDALDDLDKRYANGEIDEKEYKKMKKILK